MKTSKEVLQWLKDNAYAMKGNDYWLLREFPSGETPDKLHIPINSKRTWRQIFESEGAKDKPDSEG